MRFSVSSALALGLGFLSSTVQVDASCQSIAEIACANDDFSTLCSAVTAAGLGDALSGGSWTVFAPTNAAFEALGSELLDTVVNDVGLLTDVLLFHVVDEPIYSEDLVCASLIEMVNGQDSRTVCHGGNGADGIFQKGGTNTRDMMPEIVSADIKACNGVIHVVNQVMLPGRLKATVPPPPVECQTIAEIACGLEDFTTLCTAVTQAGLGSALSSGLWTVFAPTNDAFEALPEGTLEAVLADKDLLLDVLLFHVVANKEIFAADLRCQHLVKMGNGKNSRTVCRSGSVNGIFQKGAGNPREAAFMPKVVTTDIAACNGLIHVVNNVMLP